MAIPDGLEHAFISKEGISIEAFITRGGEVIAFEAEQITIGEKLPRTEHGCLCAGFLVMRTAPEH